MLDWDQLQLPKQISGIGYFQSTTSLSELVISV